MNFLFNAKFIINQQQNERYYELLPECKSCKNKVKADDCFSCRCFYCQWCKKCVEMKNVKEGCSRCKTKPKIGNLKKNYGLIKVFEQMEKHEYSKDGQILKEVIPKSSKMFLCNHHNEESDSFCLTCGVIFCAKCLKEKMHMNHDLTGDANTEIVKKVDDLKQKFKSTLSNAQYSRKVINKNIDDLNYLINHTKPATHK